LSTALSPFSFAGQQVRVVTDSDGEPWFMAVDVCTILDLPNVSQAISRLADDEKSTITSDEGGPDRLIVSEPGLYRLIFTSRRAEAEAFRRWIAHEVLPAIRKTGSYSVAPANLPTEIDATMLRQIAAAMEAKDQKIAELEPKADLADTYLIAQGGNRKVREAAKLLHLRERDLRRFLIDERLIFARHARCGDVQYDFYAEFAFHFQAIEHVVNHTWGQCSHYTLTITPRGMDLIKRRMAKVALPADEAARQLAEVSA